VDPGKWSTPLHLEGAEEEIFYVLGGSGVLLMYGTREPNDMCFYPRSGKILFGGLGIVTRVGEPVDYWEGED
jgi:uncharacterized cupin superfamily protein